MEPLYRRLLVERYGVLPGAVQRLHDLRQEAIWRGEGTVERGASLVARVLGAAMSLPRATLSGEVCPVTVTFSPDAGGGETWARIFMSGPPPHGRFVSYQWSKAGQLNERVLVTRFAFALEADARGLKLILRRVYVLGIPLPRALSPRIRTLESERDGHYHFDVEAELPLGLGLLVRYTGWLEALVS